MDPLLIAKKDNHLNCPAAAYFSRRRAASKGRELMPLYEQLHRGKDNHYAVRCPFAGPPTRASCPFVGPLQSYTIDYYPYLYRHRLGNKTDPIEGGK